MSHVPSILSRLRFYKLTYPSSLVRVHVAQKDNSYDTDASGSPEKSQEYIQPESFLTLSPKTWEIAHEHIYRKLGFKGPNQKLQHVSRNWSRRAVVAHTFNPGRQRQKDLFEWEANPFYRVTSRTGSKANRESLS